MADNEYDYGEEPERQEWDSGPFCPHWSDPADCDALCACGHKCGRHHQGGACGEGDCPCEEFKDP
jgi:hypothetical protein